MAEAKSRTTTKKAAPAKSVAKKAPAKVAAVKPATKKAPAKVAAKPAVNKAAPAKAAAAAVKRGHAISAEQRYRMIAEAAYYIAEKRGFAPGDPSKDWADAEAQIRALFS